MRRILVVRQTDWVAAQRVIDGGTGTMDSTKFDAIAVRLGAGISRRRLVGRIAGAGAGAALAAALGRDRAAAQTCPYGSNTCVSGYVWREATYTDLVCVTPGQRDQAAIDNANGPYRIDPNAGWGPYGCASGYVFRLATPDDLVCVTPEIRDQVAYDNSYAAGRVVADCRYG